MPYCTDCGYKIENTDKFCYKCGKPVIKEFSSLFVKPIINPSNSLKDVLKQSEVTQTQKSSTSQEKINSIESESEPTILSLPYSCVSNNVEVTLLGLALVEGYERGILLDNKKQYEVVIKFRNLLNVSNKIMGKSLGFDSLKLETDVGNIWDLRYDLGNSIPSATLDPQEDLIRNESVFEIREKEIPKYLIAEIFGKKYIFEVKLIANRKLKENNEWYQFR